MSRGGAQHCSADEATWQVASLLLGYPDDGLYARLPVLRDVVAGLPANRSEPLARFIGHAQRTPPLELAAHYVETFDRKRRCSPYLTYYAHGDTRKRGMALLELKNAYRAAGLELGDDELPDHLAVVLEFAATAGERAGRAVLSEHRAGIELLRHALEDVSSPYAAVLRAVTATLPLLSTSIRDSVLRLATEGPPAEQVGLQPFGPPDLMPQSQGARR